MGKAKTTKGRNGAPASPYDRPAGNGKKQQAPNNIFKFNTSSYGQHILKNPGIADAIVQKAFIKETDTVLEVGPGTGNISIRILEKAKKLIAVEIDPRMAAEVTKRVQGKPEQRKLEVLLGDVIKMETLPEFDVLVSNTPYQISSPLVFKILQMPKPPRCCVLMFQREFALRLTAKPGDSLYCRLSVNSQFWAKITHILKVGKKNFSPPPLVESAVVRIEPKVGSDRPNVSFEEWDGMLRICFNRRNKTLRASWYTKEVLSMVERNYRIWCSLNNVAVDDSPIEEGEDDEVMDMDLQENVEPSAGDEPLDEEEGWGGIMDVDDADNDTTPSFFGNNNAPVPKTQSKRRKTRVALLVREKIRKVLEDDTKLADQRSGKLDETDFLKLLYAFNSENIHFS
ncbi:S-adenosyl-L-methionine-dependent methyltransferase [Apiospora hydei]|uniref:rRNA adenine N(6)-methyltransferase n=1 Tax=Apiospora hydei TaxID=1337664 RepID=A0ABR1WRL6_9PEZI